jgi:cytochrome c-type biogenesis protein
MVQIALAFLAGVLTVAAPCILPMLPVLFGASLGQTSPRRPLYIALGFVLTFAVVALAFGVFANILGLSPDTLRIAATIMMGIFGILMIWPYPYRVLTLRLNHVVNHAHLIGSRAGADNLGGFVLGMTLGVIWTPCAGPVLGSILTLVATSQHLGWAAVLLVAYAIGSGVPMLGIAYGGQYVSTHVRRFARYSHRLQQGFGVVVLLTAVALYYQYDTVITVWLSNFYPNGQVGL